MLIINWESAPITGGECFHPLLFSAAIVRVFEFFGRSAGGSANRKASAGLPGRSLPTFFGPGKKVGRRRHPEKRKLQEII